jgi:hypothetical protein
MESTAGHRSCARPRRPPKLSPCQILCRCLGERSRAVYLGEGVAEEATPLDLSLHEIRTATRNRCALGRVWGVDPMAAIVRPPWGPVMAHGPWQRHGCRRLPTKLPIQYAACGGAAVAEPVIDIACPPGPPNLAARGPAAVLPGDHRRRQRSVRAAQALLLAT